MNIAGNGLNGMTENRKSTKSYIKKGPDSPIYITNKYNLCVCTIYSYHIMRNIVTHVV